ncbi:MAG TPA: FtsX-like permease family protein [Thermoplasmata archaeon]
MPRRGLAGLFLCAALLGATWPTLAALPALPGRILAGDVYAITQGSGALSVNASLVENLTSQGWLVSPEILAPTTIEGEPVLARGADPATFLALEGLPGQAPVVGDRWAFAGEGLASRLGLRVGDSVTIVGSALPRIAFAQITGTYRTDTTANDELVVDFPTARILTGLGPRNFHSIRVRTTDVASLVAFLDRTGASVHVSGPGFAGADVHSEPTTDERITNIILRTGRGGAPRDYLSSAIGEAATSVRVVAYGIAALLGLLVAFGIHAVQARAFADRRPAVGVLRALGAGNGWMRRRILRETVPAALLASTLGTALGVGASLLVRPRGVLLVFGHSIPVSTDVSVFAAIVVAVVVASLASSLVLLGRAMKVRPTESIREQPAVEPPRSLEVVLRG